jgi:putative salt-induced outer membrane protein YdiY
MDNLRNCIYYNLKWLGAALLLSMSIKVFAAPELPAPPENASDLELANYYEQLATHYRALVKQKEIKAQLNSSGSGAGSTSLSHAKPVNTTSPFAGTYAGLGYVMNTGDTSSYNLYTKGVANYLTNPNWLTVGTLTYQNAYESGKGQLANALYVDLNSANNFADNQGIYGDANYTRDTFSGYAYVINESVGYSRVLYKTPKININMQIGPGLQQQLIEGNSNTQNFLAGNFRRNQNIKSVQPVTGKNYSRQPPHACILWQH